MGLQYLASARHFEFGLVSVRGSTASSFTAHHPWSAKIALACSVAKLHPSRASFPTSPPRAFAVHITNTTHTTHTTAAMDTDMTDAGYDIDIDVGAPVAAPAQQPQQIIEVKHAQGCSQA